MGSLERSKQWGICCEGNRGRRELGCHASLARKDKDKVVVREKEKERNGRKEGEGEDGWERGREMVCEEGEKNRLRRDGREDGRCVLRKEREEVRRNWRGRKMCGVRVKDGEKGWESVWEMGGERSRRG